MLMRLGNSYGNDAAISREPSQNLRGSVPLVDHFDEAKVDHTSRSVLSPRERSDIIPGRGVLRISLAPLCNLRCKHCHNEGQVKPWLSNFAGVATIDDIEALIRAASKFGARTVRFTGGEPGLYPHFYELMSAIRNWRAAFP